MKSYHEYMKWSEFPVGLKGCKNDQNIYSLITFTISLDYEWKNKLRFVRLYFDTPTFDIITKDQAAKMVDIFSAIGGTMGLLTGFSIISAVEIIYFTAKFVWRNLIPQQSSYCKEENIF